MQQGFEPGNETSGCDGQPPPSQTQEQLLVLQNAAALSGMLQWQVRGQSIPASRPLATSPGLDVPAWLQDAAIANRQQVRTNPSVLPTAYPTTQLQQLRSEGQGFHVQQPTFRDATQLGLALQQSNPVAMPANNFHVPGESFARVSLGGQVQPTSTAAPVTAMTFQSYINAQLVAGARNSGAAFNKPSAPPFSFRPLAEDGSNNTQQALIPGRLAQWQPPQDEAGSWRSVNTAISNLGAQTWSSNHPAWTQVSSTGASLLQQSAQCLSTVPAVLYRPEAFSFTPSIAQNMSNPAILTHCFQNFSRSGIAPEAMLIAGPTATARYQITAGGKRKVEENEEGAGAGANRGKGRRQDGEGEEEEPDSGAGAMVGGGKIGLGKCEHGTRKTNCRLCGGAGICEHHRRRSQCKDCGGSAFCSHKRIRSQCRDCGGSQICEHNRRRSHCKECGGVAICQHGRQRQQCKDCGGSAFCSHGRLKRQCLECQSLAANWTTRRPGTVLTSLPEGEPLAGAGEGHGKGEGEPEGEPPSRRARGGEGDVTRTPGRSSDV